MQTALQALGTLFDVETRTLTFQSFMGEHAVHKTGHLLRECGALYNRDTIYLRGSFFLTCFLVA